MAQLVECPTLHFGSGHDPRIMGSRPVLGFMPVWSLLKILSLTLSLTLPLSPTRVLALFPPPLFQINKTKEKLIPSKTPSDTSTIMFDHISGHLMAQTG